MKGRSTSAACVHVNTPNELIYPHERKYEACEREELSLKKNQGSKVSAFHLEQAVLFQPFEPLIFRQTAMSEGAANHQNKHL